MGFFKRLFGIKEKEPEMTEEEELENVEMFIKCNAEDPDGDADCQFQYGMMFATGKGPYGRGTHTQDTNQAIYWLNKSANQGHSDAMTMLGQIYMQQENAATAVKYYKMAAQKGNAIACENLGMCYGMGDGVPVDKVEAHKWFLKAANLGSDFSQFIVGKNFFDGVGVEQDTKQAVIWFQKAADQGQRDAQFEMGQIFECGEDLDEARQWYEKAAKQGHKGAIERLKTM